MRRVSEHEGKLFLKTNTDGFSASVPLWDEGDAKRVQGRLQVHDRATYIVINYAGAVANYNAGGGRTAFDSHMTQFDRSRHQCFYWYNVVIANPPSIADYTDLYPSDYTGADDRANIGNLDLPEANLTIEQFEDHFDTAVNALSGTGTELRYVWVRTSSAYAEPLESDIEDWLDDNYPHVSYTVGDADAVTVDERDWLIHAYIASTDEDWTIDYNGVVD